MVNDADNKEGNACVGTEVTWEISIFLFVVNFILKKIKLKKELTITLSNSNKFLWQQQIIYID